MGEKLVQKSERGCSKWSRSVQACQSVMEMSSPVPKSIPSFSIVGSWQSLARLHSTSFHALLCSHVPNSLKLHVTEVTCAL